MKLPLLSSLLLGVLLVLSVVNAFMAVRFVFSAKELEKLQGQTYRNNQILGAFEALLNESIRFANQNTNIIPIIQQLESEIKLKTNPPPAIAPVGSPQLPAQP